jgi:hypothetical protein
MKTVEDNYKCVISLGMRCHTEIFLKHLGLKHFSGPFDGMYSKSLLSIIYLLENKLSYSELLYTEDLQDENIKHLNIKHGYRTIHKLINYNKDNLEYSYHYSLLPHHNLKNNLVKDHFERCFTRLDKIKIYKIKTLFSLFIHPDYSDDMDVSIEEINILKNYLHNNYNCNLLVCKFKKTKQNYEWNILLNENNLIYIHINNSSHIFENNEKVLKEIFIYLNIYDNNALLKYDEIEKFHI